MRGNPPGLPSPLRTQSEYGANSNPEALKGHDFSRATNPRYRNQENPRCKAAFQPADRPSIGSALSIGPFAIGGKPQTQTPPSEMLICRHALYQSTGFS
jgi:hypothetical protein